VDVELAHGFAVGLDFDHGVLADAVELGLAAAGDAADDGANLSGEAFEFVVAVAKDFAHEVGACSGHDLVEAHLDGLGDEDVLAGHLIEQRLAHESRRGVLC
jgi:hypothetical protein